MRGDKMRVAGSGGHPDTVWTDLSGAAGLSLPQWLHAGQTSVASCLESASAALRARN